MSTDSDAQDDDRQQAEANIELELLTLAALARCADAGGAFNDLHFLAAQLGVGEPFKRAHASAPAK